MTRKGWGRSTRGTVSCFLNRFSSLKSNIAILNPDLNPAKQLRGTISCSLNKCANPSNVNCNPKPEKAIRVTISCSLRGWSGALFQQVFCLESSLSRFFILQIQVQNLKHEPKPCRINTGYDFVLSGQVCKTLNSALNTPHPTPYTIYPTPYAPHHTLCTLHPKPYSPRPKPFTPHPTSYTLHPTPLTLIPDPGGGFDKEGVGEEHSGHNFVLSQQVFIPQIQ